MTISEMWEKIKNSPSEVWWRVCAWGVSSFILIPCTSYVLLYAYMLENKFFSYDLFSSSGTVINLIFLEAGFSSISSGIFLGLLASALRKVIILHREISGSSVGVLEESETNANRAETNENNDDELMTISHWRGANEVLILMGICTVFSILKISGIMLNHIPTWLIDTLVPFVVGTHVFILLTHKAKYSFLSLTVITIFFVHTSLQFEGTLSSIAHGALREIGMGGDTPALVELASKEKIDGKLKLISPNYIYIQAKDEIRVTTIPMTQVSFYKLLGKSEKIEPLDGRTSGDSNKEPRK